MKDVDDVVGMTFMAINNKNKDVTKQFMVYNNEENSYEIIRARKDKLWNLKDFSEEVRAQISIAFEGDFSENTNSSCHFCGYKKNITCSIREMKGNG